MLQESQQKPRALMTASGNIAADLRWWRIWFISEAG